MTKVFGLDVHPSFQPFMDFHALKDDPNWDMRFVIVKSSEGYGYKVKRYPEYVRRINEANMLPGNYHYFWAADADTKWEAERQAEYAVGIAGENPFAFGCDLEDNHNLSKGYVTPQNVTDGFLWFMDKVEFLTKRIPINYTADWFLRKIPFHEQFLKYPLWVASYQYPDKVNPDFNPVMPYEWKKRGIDWHIHQFSTKYVNTDVAVRGYEWPTGSGNWHKSPIKSINCDINRTTEDKLNELLGVTPPLDPPTDPPTTSPPPELVAKWKDDAKKGRDLFSGVEALVKEYDK